MGVSRSVGESVRLLHKMVQVWMRWSGGGRGAFFEGNTLGGQVVSR